MGEKSDSGIVWEAPPAAARSSRSLPHPQLAAFAAALRSRPGEWALYPRPLSSGSCTVTQQVIKQGQRSKWTPAGTFDATVRTVDGQRRLYVRYIGEAEAGSAA